MNDYSGGLSLNDAYLLAEREDLLLAPYAMRSCLTAGRRWSEPTHAYRGPFQRDRDRIVHCGAYRRLSGKMQVFTGELGDYHRNRLTHTHEVASVARTLGRSLRLHEDLIEALALMHDIGHPPFGHAGEDTLDACLADCGGFSHNQQALRIVELIEQRYIGFAGLNLSREVLEGQATRIDHSSEPGRSPLLEVQVVEAADSIAYDTHDADDALRLGLLKLDDLLQLPLWAEAARRVRRVYAGLNPQQLVRCILHELIDWQVSDLLAHTERRLSDEQVDSLAAVRRAPILVRVGSELAELKAELEQFLFAAVYRHPQVLVMRDEAQSQLAEMFELLCQRPELLPPSYAARTEQQGLKRNVADYLAGMTDRFAQQFHQKLVTHGAN